MVNVKRSVLSVLALLAFFAASAGGNYTITNFTISHGLPSGKIFDVFQDSRGFLWLASDAGIARFDGSRFEQYSLSDGLNHNTSTAFAEDRNGHMWVATGRGFARFDGLRFSRVDSFQGKRIEFIRDILCLDDGSVLACFKGGIYHWKAGALRLMTTEQGLISNNVFSLVKLSDGRILATCENGVSVFSGRQWKTYFAEPGKKVIYMVEDSEGDLWYTTLHNELKRFNGTSSSLVEVPGADTISISGKLSADNNGFVYVAHEDFITFYHHDKGYRGQVSHFLNVRSDAVNSLFMDRENILWAGSLYGLWKIAPTFVESFPIDNVKGQSIYSISIIDGDSVIISDGQYVYSVQDKRIAEIFKDKPASLGEILAMQRDVQGNWYFASSLGGILCRSKKGKYTLFSNKDQAFTPLFSMATSPEGAVIFGAPESLWYCEDGTCREKKAWPELKGKNVLALAYEDEKNLWIGTTEGFFKLQNGRLIDFSYIFRGMPVVCSDIHVFGTDSLLVATRGAGILLLKESNDSLHVLSTINRSSGLPSEFVVSVITDDYGNIWASSFSGIVRISPEKLAYNIEHLSESRGIPNGFWNYCRFEKDAKGHLWIGSSNSFLRINPHAYFIRKGQNRIFITKVLVNGQELVDTTTRNAWFFPYPASVSLDYQKNSFSFEFTGINFTNPIGQMFVYQLKGLENSGWSNPVSDRKITFTNLAPGQYEFLVRTLDGSPGEVASYLFVVEKPFWQMNWFRLTVLLSTLGVIATYIRWRIFHTSRKQQEKLQVNKELSESRFLAFQARMNPHFVFNSLNSIQYFITNNDKASSLNYLSRFARLLRQILDNSRELKIPLKEELDLLKNYIEMEAMRFEQHFKWTLEVDPDLDINNLEVPGMLLQPFVENAIIHGLLHKKNEDGKLCISVKKESGYAVCRISDNGIGREKSARINSARKPNHKSYGTEIAINRLRLLNENGTEEGLLTIEDLKDESGSASGTRVTIKLPII